jgi:hypothetical protein
MKLLALAVAGLDLVDADMELADGTRMRVRFDVSPQDDGALAAWEPDVFHDEPMPRGGVSKFVQAVLYFNAVAHRLDDS